ncbi:hypothetical protein K469DRAFT_685348 [Zopfia rhizophila CBS 207.26]|uniref:HAT C-terminal dimerisation domain-containing protein n=1 Tax=Zopfia rhizophila CBS 207.26 TaxID=1314779 RepID=A0A6A6EBT7_9PEZI|nr:hypothetical protein K469DRAFT_685348 [Zopfia rhizophila CBS 207.26]
MTYGKLLVSILSSETSTIERVYRKDRADWWENQDCSRNLKDLAIYAPSINPTIGPVERNWSVHGFIQNKSRNRLANPKVEMLVYLFTNLRIRDQIASEDPQYFDEDEVEENEADELEDD